MKYGFGIKIIPDQSLAFLQYRFTDVHGEEIDMKEEIENQVKEKGVIKNVTPFLYFTTLICKA